MFFFYGFIFNLVIINVFNLSLVLVKNKHPDEKCFYWYIHISFRNLGEKTQFELI